MIELVKDSDIKYRIRKDRTIEFARKWEPKLYDLINEIRFGGCQDSCHLKHD